MSCRNFQHHMNVFSYILWPFLSGKFVVFSNQWTPQAALQFVVQLRHGLLKINAFEINNGK